MNRLSLVGIVLGLACGSALAESVSISEWLVPWQRSEPRDPFVDDGGRVWFVGRRGDYVANLVPETGNFSRYDLPPGSGPQSLLRTADGILWYAGNRDAYIGRLDPATGRVARIGMPERRARDPHSLALDGAGNIWFTVEDGNFVGRLEVATLEVALLPVAQRKARPTGIAVSARGEPWATASDRNLLLRIDPDALTIAAITLPEKKARPAGIALTADGRVWYTDRERGYLGSFDPQSGEFLEWSPPGGDDSEPLPLAADRFGRLWLVETGREPNRFVGFDPSRGDFFSVTDIPSGAGRVERLHYYEPAGEIWFGTETNYIGRAGIH